MNDVILYVSRRIVCNIWSLTQIPLKPSSCKEEKTLLNKYELFFIEIISLINSVSLIYMIYVTYIMDTCI